MSRNVRFPTSESTNLVWVEFRERSRIICQEETEQDRPDRGREPEEAAEPDRVKEEAEWGATGRVLDRQETACVPRAEPRFLMQERLLVSS
jgi:hypothetical protein